MQRTKYSKEFREEIKAQFENGLGEHTISKMYNICRSTVNRILDEATTDEERKAVYTAKNVVGDRECVDSKFEDSKKYEAWKETFYNKLEATKTFGKYPIIHLSKTGFTYKGPNGYGIYKDFNEIYQKLKDKK